jgi:hypothetical protein
MINFFLFMFEQLALFEFLGAEYTAFAAEYEEEKEKNE